jgi:aminoglycoside phosphotransferase (APT) family kinase protein
VPSFSLEHPKTDGILTWSRPVRDAGIEDAWIREVLALAAPRERFGIDGDLRIGGGACDVAFCGSLVVRRPLHPYHRLRFAHEVALLPALARLDLPAATPQLLWHRLDPPVMVYRRIGGVAARSPFRDHDATPPSDAVLFACGYFLGHLHRLGAGGHGLPWLPSLERDALRYLAGVLAAGDVPGDIRAFGEAALADWSARSGCALPPTLVHNDVNWKNLLLTASHSGLTGVIDWSISGIADPHWDFGYLGSWGPERFAAVAIGYGAARGHGLDLRAADAAVRLRLLGAILHGPPDERRAAVGAARAHVPLA